MTAVSNYGSSHPEKEKPEKATPGVSKSTASKPTGSGAGTKIKKNTDGDKEKKKKEEKEKEEDLEPWWPPFHFDGRQALRTKMCINLRNCQYDLFKTIALKELGWRVVDWRNRVVDLESLKEEEARAAQKAAEKKKQEAGEDND